MNFDDILVSELPEPREDEPESLRRDIIDELSDHLDCSYRKELLSGTDAEAARRRVLGRFGNPATIAARLWLDAMKGKIMSQRILIAACVLLAISCLGLVGMSWLHWDRMNRIQAEQLAASQAMQDVMLKQMQALTKAVEHPRSPDWNPASFKLTEETLDGPPVVGVNVSFTKNGMNQETIQRVSDDKGIVDFGAIQPGGYNFYIDRRSNGRRGNWATSGNVQVKPYQDIFKSIVCPQADARSLPISLEFKPPAPLSGRGLYLHVAFRGLQRKLPDGTTWTYYGLEEGDEARRIWQGRGMGGGMGGGSGPEIPRLDLLIDLDTGKIERIRGAEPFYSSDGTIPNQMGFQQRPQDVPTPNILGHAWAAFRRSDRTQVSGELTVLEGDRGLVMLAVLRPQREESTPQVDFFDVVAIDSKLVSGMSMQQGNAPDWLMENIRSHIIGPFNFYSALDMTKEAPTPYWSAEMDRLHTWTIEPPQALVDATLNALKAEEEVKSDNPETPKSQEAAPERPRN